MKHTLTADDVHRIFAEETAQGKTPTEARQGTRTQVHVLIHEQNPTPMADRPTHLVGIEEREKDAKGRPRTLTRAENEQIRQHQLAQVTEAHMIASEKARSGPDSTHRDAHHYVQKMHQKAIWEETDRLVTAALGGAS
jgi:hypothetical protein